MLRRLGIRGKVLAALSVPVLVLFLLATVVSWQSIQDVQTRRATQDVIKALEYAGELVTALQDERAAALPLMGEQGNAEDAQSQGRYEDATASTDAALARFKTMAAKIDFAALDAQVKADFTSFGKQLDWIDTPRTYVAAGQTPVGTVDRSYQDGLETMIKFRGTIAAGIDDRRVARLLTFESNATELIEAYRHEQALGREVILVDGRSVDVDRLVRAFANADDLRMDLYAELTDMGLTAQLQAVLLDTGPGSFSRMRASITALPQGVALPAAVTTDAWTNAAVEETDAIQAVQDEAHTKAVKRAASVESSEFRGAVLTIGVVVAGVILSVVTALSIAGGIVRPLRRLTEAAGTVRDELPHLVEQVAIPGQGPDLRLTRIPVTSRDEVGRLAAAFNEVNQTTIEVAQEQAALRASIAEMFVNVARRDQVLLNRQLSFIDALERSEENPKILADLFRLDHLATRMRRNAESLLVLAGIDTGRRLREALPTSDVIRTASSEIEHYERIQLDLPVDPMMLGHTALPAAHMLAELLENATVFSDPGTPVFVSTGIDENHVIITIHDQGLGMLPEELEMANTKIAKTSASDVLGSQRLGLYVVGRIAARLGASVELTKGIDGKGTLATVRMPLVLFMDPQSIPLTAPTQRQVQAFVLPEEAAAVVHDTAYAPAPASVQDVAPGAYGSAENPAQEVDLAALTEGTTGLGLPKRRGHSDAPSTWDMAAGDQAAASAIPLAPSPDALAGAAALGGVEETWQPPVVQTSKPLVSRRPVDAPPTAPALPARQPAAGGLPVRAPSGPATGAQLPVRGGTGQLPVRTATGSQPPVPQSLVGGPTASGLPARRPTGPGGPTAPEAVSTASATGPENVEGRTAMFAGFRSRRAEVQAAAIQEAGAAQQDDATDAVDRLAAAATGAAAFFRRGDASADEPVQPQPEPYAEAPAAMSAPAEPVRADGMVIPSLVDDDEGFGDAAFAPGAPAQPAAFQTPATGSAEPWAPQWQLTPPPEAAQPAAAEPWAPQWAEPEPVADAFRPVPVEEPMAPPAAAPVAAQPWAPQWAEPEPVAQAPAWQAPVPTADAVPMLEPDPVAPAFPAPVGEPVQPAAAQPWAAVPSAWVGADAPAAPAPAPAAEAPVWPWEQAPAAPAAPAQPPAYQPPSFGAPAPMPTATPAAAEGFGHGPVDFADLVQGPTRRSMREPKRRGGLFRRRKEAEYERPETLSPESAPMPAPLPPVASGPPAPAFAPPMGEPAGAPSFTETPVRQSAWGAPSNGSHAVAEPQPEPAAWQAPAFGGQPAQFAAQPADVAQEWPAASWQAPQPAAPVAPVEPVAPEPVAAAPVAPVAPQAPSTGAWQPAQGWAPDESWPQPATPAFTPPVAQAPAAPAAPAAAAPLPGRAPAQSGFSGPTAFSPQPMFGFDDEMTSMLAQRADIAQQALAELNQLSMYRPQAVASTSSLVRRTPTAVPAAPAISTTSSSPRPSRDANQVRSLLSSFQSGTSRGRQLADSGDDAAQKLRRLRPRRERGGSGRTRDARDHAGHRPDHAGHDMVTARTFSHAQAGYLEEDT